MALQTVTLVLDETWRLISNSVGRFKVSTESNDGALFYLGDSAPAASYAGGQSDRRLDITSLETKVWAKAAAKRALITVTRVVDAANHQEIVLGDIGLSVSTFASSLAAGAEIGTVTGRIAGDGIRLLPKKGGLVELNSDRTKLVRGLGEASSKMAAVDYEIEIEQFHPLAANSPKRTKIPLIVTLGAGGGGGPVLKPIAESFMIQGLGAAFPTGSVTAIAAGKEAQFCRVAITSSDYVTGRLRALWTNNYSLTVAKDGPSDDQFIYQLGNAVTVHKIVAYYNGTVYPVTFNGGLSSGDIADGGFFMIDEIANFPALPANTKFFFDLVYSVPVGANRIAGRSRVGNAGEVSTNDSLANLSVLLSRMGQVNPGGVGEGGGLGQLWAPALVVGTGNDGREVVMFHGDSFAAADGDNLQLLSDYYVSGPIARGMQSTAQGTKRIPHVNWAIAGSRPSGFRDMGVGHWKAYHDMLSAVMGLNSGRAPFTTFVCEHINNQMTAPSQTIDTVKQAMQDIWSFMKGLYACRVVQVSPVPASALDVINQGTTVASQSFRSADLIYPVGSGYNGARWVLDNYMRAQVGSLIDGFVDYLPTLCDPDTRHWKPRAYSGKVTTANTAGGLTISLDTLPPIGEALAFDPGGTNYENVGALPTVRSVTGTGPYAITMSAGLAKVHAVNETVKGAPSKGDLVHGSPAVYIELGDGVWCAAKASGIIRQAGVA